MNVNIMGIYKITNVSNNKIYIGSSVDIPKRWKQHISELNRNKHNNKHLQRAWNFYGEEKFIFEIAELVYDEDLLKSAEQKWINKTKCYDGNYGYNLSIDAERPNKYNEVSHMNGNIVLREKLKNLKDLNLSNNEKLVYYTLRDYVEYPTNCVVIDGKILSISEYSSIVGLTERSIIPCLKSLEEKKLVKLIQYGHRKAIYINPEYYTSGKDVCEEVLVMFKLIESDTQ